MMNIPRAPQEPGGVAPRVAARGGVTPQEVTGGINTSHNVVHLKQTTRVTQLKVTFEYLCFDTILDMTLGGVGWNTSSTSGLFFSPPKPCETRSFRSKRIDLVCIFRSNVLLFYGPGVTAKPLQRARGRIQRTRQKMLLKQSDSSQNVPISSLLRAALIFQPSQLSVKTAALSVMNK